LEEVEEVEVSDASDRPKWIVCPTCEGFGEVPAKYDPNLVDDCPTCEGTLEILNPDYQEPLKHRSGASASEVLAAMTRRSK